MTTGTVVAGNEPEYERLERNSISILNEVMEAKLSGKALKKSDAIIIKTAQSSLASVQSHRKTKLGERALDFTLARTLTTDPDKLAEYVRLTQHDSPVVKALPEPESV